MPQPLTCLWIIPEENEEYLEEVEELEMLALDQMSTFDPPPVSLCDLPVVRLSSDLNMPAQYAGHGPLPAYRPPSLYISLPNEAKHWHREICEAGTWTCNFCTARWTSDALPAHGPAAANHPGGQVGLWRPQVLEMAKGRCPICWVIWAKKPSRPCPQG